MKAFYILHDKIRVWINGLWFGKHDTHGLLNDSKRDKENPEKAKISQKETQTNQKRPKIRPKRNQDNQKQAKEIQKET